MPAIAKYGFLNAKIRAMRSTLLADSVYRALASAKDNRELSSVLQKTRFREFSERINWDQPLAVQRDFLVEEIHTLQRIQSFSKHDVRFFVDLLLERYDAEKVKMILRLWHSKSKDHDLVVRETIVHAIPVDDMLSAPTLKDMAEYLRDTPFYDPLMRNADVYQEKNNLFSVEMDIDREMMGRIWKSADSMNRQNQKIVHRLVGMEADIKNLLWIGRFKHYYNIPSSEIMAGVFDFGYRITKEQRRQFASEGKIQKVFSNVIPAGGVNWNKTEGTKQLLETLESFFYHVLFQEANRAFIAFPFSIGSVLGFFYLIRIETKNILTLLEARSYGLPPERIEALMVV
jgi:vacuolar-type H+-ATPase subunit C/Vma6